jgi:hypothetical protein
MPKKCAFTIANLITFLRVVLAIIVSVGSVNEEEVCVPNRGEIKVGLRPLRRFFPRGCIPQNCGSILLRIVPDPIVGLL